MASVSSPRLTVDPHLVLEGVAQPDGAAGAVLEAWSAGLLDVYLTTALAYATVELVWQRRTVANRDLVRPVLSALLRRSRYVPLRFTWRPVQPGLGAVDLHLIECAMNAGARIITARRAELALARQALGLSLDTPLELVTRLGQPDPAA